MNPSTARPAVLLAGVACAVAILAACGPDDLPPPVPLASPVGGAQPISRANYLSDNHER